MTPEWGSVGLPPLGILCGAIRLCTRKPRMTPLLPACTPELQELTW